MTKRLFLFLTVFALFFNCTFTETPEYTGLQNIKVLSVDNKTITVSADAHFNNPNDVGGQLQAKDLKLYVNDSEVALINSKPFDVPSKERFTIPLTVKVETNKIIDKKSLNGLLSSIIAQKIEIQYKGKINYTILGYSSTYAVDETQNIKLKL
ncbi:LEA type 2 family protein [Winogradskyella immobilis]|uniref:LEA type 2 family protein n=1 Tax=Winogradskyella immobilis TaxID=2816852 RepID=A0ABS8ENJ8_9FLAO|nr:LEA type 2 family protein [Winogradskyella immobilis]MCC1484789.1 LEA type 2 family protein [Winogradskyella immobilis]MCG0016881.1 LEA type 2 family protein [Winogradskyella immobilis]